MFHIKMDDERLIELVCEHEFLYNLKHPKYMDNNKKEIVWKEIGHKLKQSAGDCKKRWQCLRDAYRRALNKKKGKSEQEAKNMKPWKYENEMTFVAPFIIERKNKDCIDVTSDDELSENGEENYTTERNAPENHYIHIDIEDTPAEVSDAKSTESDEAPQNEPKQKRTRKTLKRKLSKTEPQAKSEPSVRTVLMANLIEELTKTEPPRGNDELERFFLNIHDTVKKFSPHQQAQIKNKVFNLVSDMELQQFAPPRTSTRRTSIYDPPGQPNRNPSLPHHSDRYWNKKLQLFFRKINSNIRNRQ